VPSTGGIFVNNLKYMIILSNVCEMKRCSLVYTGDISPEILGEYRLRRKGRATEMGFQLVKEKRD